MKLKQHIKDHYDNNLASFARHIGSTYQQVQRWIKLDCIWLGGIIYAPKHETLVSQVNELESRNGN